MPDQIETLMEQKVPALTAVVRKGLEEAHIEQLVRFEPSSSGTPWRVENVTWPDAPVARPPASSGAPPFPNIAVRQAQVDPDRAYEVSGTLERDADGLSQVSPEAELQELARAVAGAYRTTVIALIAADLPTKRSQYRQAVVDDLVGRPPGWWRLIGTGEIARKIKDTGTAEVTDPKGALNGLNLGALVLSTFSGPIVQELDVPCLVWNRTPDKRVTLTVARRFFFRAGTGTVGLNP